MSEGHELSHEESEQRIALMDAESAQRVVRSNLWWVARRLGEGEFGEFEGRAARAADEADKLLAAIQAERKARGW